MTNTDNQSIVKLVNRPELFTRHECETILKTMLADQSQKGSLKEFRVVPAMQNIGFLGEYHHLILDYQLENETEQHTRRLFVKSANKSVDKSFYDQYISISRKEAQLYGLLLNDLQKFCKYNCFSNWIMVYNFISFPYQQLRFGAPRVISIETTCLLCKISRIWVMVHCPQRRVSLVKNNCDPC